MHLFFNVLLIIFFTWKVRFCKTWGLIQWIFLKLFEKIIMLHTESSSTCDKVFHIRSLLFAGSFPHLGQNSKETCTGSTRWTKHGFEERSCVTVSFSLPTLGFLGLMCSEDFEISCEDFEMCCEDFEICCEDFDMCREDFRICSEFKMCFKEFGMCCV